MSDLSDYIRRVSEPQVKALRADLREAQVEAKRERARADRAERMVEAAAATLHQAAGWCRNTRHSRMTRAQIADALERDAAIALSAGSGGRETTA